MRSASRWFYLISLGLWGFLGLFLVFVVPSAHAAGVTYTTTRVGNGTYVPTGVQVPTTVNVAMPGDVARYQQVAPTANKQVVGRVARAAIRGGPAQVAIIGAIEGAGYLVDSLQGQVTKLEVQPRPAPSNPNYAVSSTSRINCNGGQLPASYQYETFRVEDYPCFGETELAKTLLGWTCASGYYSYEHHSYYRACYPEGVDLSPVETIVPITEDDIPILDDAIWAALTPEQKADLIEWAIRQASPRGSVDTDSYPINPLTSSNTSIQNFYNEFPEFRVAMQNMLNAEIAAWLASQDPEFQPSPDEQVIIDEGTPTPPLEPPPTLELPDFCDWASFICEPFEGGDHPDVPVLDLETPEYDSGLPGGSTCPQPIEVATGFGVWELSLQPACDLASAIRTPLIAISYLTAAFIVVGVRK